MAKKKKQNVFVRYFVPFGIRQLCDIMMLVASVLLIIGLAAYESLEVLIVVGLAMFAVAALLSLVRSIKVMTSNINHRAPEYKNAVANLVLAIIILALAVFGMIWYFM